MDVTVCTIVILFERANWHQHIKKKTNKQMMGLISEETVVLLHLGSDKENLEVSIQSQITTIRIL